MPDLLFRDTAGREDPGCCCALATAVRGCREALMSCIMGVHWDAGMEGWREHRVREREYEGARNQIPAPALCCAALLSAAQTLGEG